jgi:putative aldouronate transport system substrate-binding protein
MKRYAVVLTVLLSISGLPLWASGQGEGAAKPAAPSGGAAVVAESYTLPLVKAPVTISFATQENPAGTRSYRDNLPAWAELEKRTGVKVDFQVVPATNYAENIQVRLAAGVNLPDFLLLPPNPMSYANAKLLVPMKGLIERYAPNIVRLFAERPEIKRGLIAPDGDIYFVTSILDARASVNYNAFLYRRDWAQKVGLGAPVTIADWYAMLRKFKEGDINGNRNDNDEWPWAGNGSGYSALNPFAMAYGLMLPNTDGKQDSDNYQVGKDGKVSYIYTMPRLKDWLTEMAKWYREGLIDPEFLTMTQDKWLAKVVSNVVGSACQFTMWAPQLNPRMAKDFPEAYWDTLYPPKGPYGDQNLLRERPLSGENFAISRDCKNVALVMKWVDYLFASEEGQILMGNYGIEGVSYSMVDGKPRFTDLIAKDPRGTGQAQWEFGMNGPFPRILMKQVIVERFYGHPQAKVAVDAAEKYYVHSFPNIIPTKEENDAIVNTMADINTYRSEMVTKFILGTEPLSSLDKFMSTINGMGIGEVTAIKQKQYDRVSR